METWTRRVIRHRKKIIVLWLLLFAFGAYGISNIGGLLSNRFSVPGSDAEKGLNLAKDRLHERGDGAFTLIGQTDKGEIDRLVGDLHRGIIGVGAAQTSTRSARVTISRRASRRPLPAAWG